MKQAAMYVRVSTQQQKEGATIESQKALLLQHAKEKGFEIIPEWVFEDNGISGSKLARPALDRLRDLASEGLFENVFILSPDRLSRKYAYQAILMEEFGRNNIAVIFQNSPSPKTATDHLLLQMQGMFAEYERAQITERSRRGKNHKARNGNVSVLSHAPYGYRYIKGSDGFQAYFEIVDKEASVVKTIFDLYIKERLPIEKIRAYLLSHGIRSPKGNLNWSRSTINGILKNSTYRGIAFFGKKEKCEPDQMRLPGRKVRINGRRSPSSGQRRKNPKEWIAIPVPAIIENEVFELSQDLLKKNKEQSIRNSKPGSLLQGLISCKECGFGFITTVSGKKTNGYNYYRCSKLDKKCINRGIRIETLDDAIWGSLISILESPDLIQEEISRRISDLEKAPILQKQKLLEAQLVKLEQESNRLLDAYQSGCVDLTELKKRINVIQREKNNTTREITEISSGLSKKQFLELKETVAYFSKHLNSSQKELSFEEKRRVLRMLIQEIQIGKDDITINHIIPLKQNVPFEKNARLHTDCRDGETLR
jgi:site-specific DNA recombinase